MCGIAGILYQDERPVERAQANLFLKGLQHRGPDGSGFHELPGGFFAHTRLAILDPESGTQPMLSEDGRYCLTYNGEIYNFKTLQVELEKLGCEFKTRCDTEVLLAAFEKWGKDCLSRLEGMFAFAVYDKKEKKLFLARDRLGIKPLYYYRSSEAFYFTSELRTLSSQDEFPQILDYQALDDYLHYQYVPHSWTIYEGVKKLSPGNFLEIDLSQPDKDEPKSYWAVATQLKNSKSEEEWLAELDRHFDRAIESHLVSDVPFGVYLSGGVDSSLVAKRMHEKVGTDLKAFTLGFNHVDYNEIDQARLHAKRIGCQHYVREIDVPPFEIIDKLAAAYGEPFADSSAIALYYVSELAVSHGVKMVLSGDGGDELFGGYNTYETILQNMSMTKPFWKRWLRPNEPSMDALAWHSQVYAYFKDGQRDLLYSSQTKEKLERHPREDFRRKYWQPQKTSYGDLTRLQYLDLNTYLPDDILTKVDIASMQHSLEVRVPLLDHRLVEFAFSMPENFKIKKNQDGRFQKKYLWNRFAEKELGSEFLNQQKKGFGVPLAEWFKGPWNEQLKERILSGTEFFSELMDRRALENLLAADEKLTTHAPQIWALLMLEAWTRTCVRPREVAQHV